MVSGSFRAQYQDLLESLLWRRDVERQEASVKSRRNAVQDDSLHSISATREHLSQSSVLCLEAFSYENISLLFA